MKYLFSFAAALVVVMALGGDAKAQCGYGGPVYYSGPVYYCQPPVYYCQPPRVVYYYSQPTYYPAPTYTTPYTRPAPSSTYEPPTYRGDKTGDDPASRPIRRPAPSSTYEPK